MRLAAKAWAKGACRRSTAVLFPLLGILGWILAEPQVGLGQTISGAGTTAAPFLKIGIGGRAVGMGEAYVTQAEDVTGLYWNPAGTANIPSLQILLNHFDYIADLHYEYAGLAMPFRNVGTFGAFFSYLGMPDIERTTVTFPEGNGEQVSAYSFAVGLTYARALTDRFSIGGSAKLVKETIWHSTATGLAFDVGLLYRAFFRNVRIGMCIANFGADMQMSGRDMLVQHDIADNIAGNNRNINAHLDTDAFPLPILFRVGISADLARDFLGMENYDWIVAADAVHPSDNREFVNLGTELRLRNLVALRCGYRQLFLEDREGGLSFGAGLCLRLPRGTLWLDYATADYGRLDRQNKFSLIFQF
jgi:hypothetical protein